ncbi:hypothetical protein COJ96_19800 [Bacillus sp. AFS073361]|nr:hypothetical protein COJ96_19800 [Bacillus sp. AFS073361]
MLVFSPHILFAAFYVHHMKEENSTYTDWKYVDVHKQEKGGFMERNQNFFKQKRVKNLRQN